VGAPPWPLLLGLGPPRRTARPGVVSLGPPLPLPVAPTRVASPRVLVPLDQPLCWMQVLSPVWAGVWRRPAPVPKPPCPRWRVRGRPRPLQGTCPAQGPRAAAGPGMVAATGSPPGPGESFPRWTPWCLTLLRLWRATRMGCPVRPPCRVHQAVEVVGVLQVELAQAEALGMAVGRVLWT
jgi:hypothetical protein